jgi:hypothetical protein
MKDSGILDKNLSSTDIDLIFAKAKVSSSIRKIDFSTFKHVEFYLIY